MALNIPNNLYTAGAVELDSTPSTNLYGQVLQRREAQRLAKEQAFDEYIRNLNTKVNSAGMRSQDAKAFQYFLKKWQDHSIQNKGRIMGGDIQAQTENNALYQNAINVVNEGKDKESMKKPMVDILTDPKKRPLLTELSLKAIADHDQPLYVENEKGEFVRNEARKDINYQSNLFNPTFDATKAFESWSKGMPKEKKIGAIVSRDPITGTVTRKFTESYSPEGIKQIAVNAAKDIQANPEDLYYYQHRWESISTPELEEYNKALQSVFGKYAAVRSPQEIAAAEAIIRARSMEKEQEESVLDRQLANERAINKIHISANLFRGNEGGGTGKGNVFDTMADNDFGNFKISGGQFYNADGSPKTGKVFIKGEYIPAPLMSTLKAGGIDPKSLILGVTADVDGGQIKSISSPYIGTITREAMEGVYQPKMDTERKGEGLKFGGQSNKTTTKPSQRTYRGLDKNGNPIYK